MKSTLFRLTLLTSLIVSMSFLTASCSNNNSNQAAASVEKKILYWVAPMDPNYRRDSPGKSPMGMDLIPLYEETEDKKQTKKEKKILYWVAPMDRNYRRDNPGKSPMGMDLIPMYAEEDSAADDTGGLPIVKIKPEIINNMGVRIAPVKRAPLPQRIDTVGYVKYDEERVSRMHARVEGWVERLVVKSVGERVKKGQLLFELYAPKLVSAQQEYLIAYKQAKAIGGNNVGHLLKAVRQRLRLLGVSPDQIARLESTGKLSERIRMRASQDGVVVVLNIREGTYVTPKMAMLTLGDLSRVWIEVDVFDRQSNWVKRGQAAEVRLSYLPGRVFKGVVDYVYPALDPKTRTLKARLRFPNPNDALKPNMYGEVVIFGGATTEDTLSVPREALIRTGKRQSVVLALGKGQFQPVDVVPGIESGDLVEIRKGVKEGDHVVVSGQFLIDSESNLKASFRRITAPKPQPESMADSKSTQMNSMEMKP